MNICEEQEQEVTCGLMKHTMFYMLMHASQITAISCPSFAAFICFESAARLAPTFASLIRPVKISLITKTLRFDGITSIF